jgi:hypothetical protein
VAFHDPCARSETKHALPPSEQKPSSRRAAVTGVHAQIGGRRPHNRLTGSDYVKTSHVAEAHSWRHRANKARVERLRLTSGIDWRRALAHTHTYTRARETPTAHERDPRRNEVGNAPRGRNRSQHMSGPATVYKTQIKFIEHNQWFV